MYNTSKIDKIKEQIQSEIDAVLAKFEPIMNDAIAKQIPKTNHLVSGMGTTFCCNKIGTEVGVKFTDHINILQYSDCFNTGINIKDVNPDALWHKIPM